VAIRALPMATVADPVGATQAQTTTLGYLAPQPNQMQYARFRAQRLPIGSGIVESANKLVVEARLEGAGRKATSIRSWRYGGALLQSLSGGVDGYRGGTPGPGPPPCLRGAPLPSVASARQPPPRSGPKTIVNSRPTARHPWQRFPDVPPHPPAKP
jgi:hypothetical protein